MTSPITWRWYAVYELVDGNAAVDEDADAARTLQGFNDELFGSSSSVAEAAAAGVPSTDIVDADVLAVESPCPLAYAPT
jgi:hypothetical protein